jgi:hypothetical protein
MTSPGRHGDGDGFCRECGKPLPHRRRKPQPAWTYLPILASGWIIGIWILLLLTRQH